MEKSYTLKVCHSCSSFKLLEFLDLGHHPPPLGFTASRSEGPKTLYPVKVFRCETCGLIQLGYVTDPKILWGGEYFYNSGATASFKQHLKELADKMMMESQPKFVVDIGSNDGTALMPYHSKGVKVLGVDPSSVGAKANDSVPTWNTFFNLKTAKQIARREGKADLITAFNVFAHVPLYSFMRGVCHLLKPNGIFLTESQYLVDIIGKLGYDTIYLEHLRYYSLLTLIELLREYGLEVFHAERIPSIGGSIRVFAKQRGKNRALFITPSVKQLLDLEFDFGLQNLETYTRFAKRVEKNKTELNSLLWRLKYQGNRIAGIGAPGRSSTIINYCGIGPDLLDYLADTNPLKIGRLSPGAEIPIVSEDKLIEDQPDYAVNFLWYLPEIIPKLRRKGYNGKIIMPLPTVEVLF